MKRQLNITSFTQTKRNKTDNLTSENVSIEQSNLSELPSTSKNYTDNHTLNLTPNSHNSMPNDLDKTLTAGVNDIGNYVHNLEIDDFKKEELLKTPWVPHLTYIFPVKTKRNLRFQLSWIQRFSWLSYSQIFEGAFCRPCVLFAREKGGKGGHQQLGALVSKEYANWKNSLQDFQLHTNTSYHKFKQEIALRGSNDFGNVMNTNSFIDGNFRALLRFRVDSGDTILEEHLNNGPKNSLYTSPGIQNEIISICGDIIKSKIVQRVNTAECFSVLADETTDIGRIEQMSVCLRYYDQSDKKIREDFLELTAVDLTGKGLAILIMKSLQNNSINCQFLVGQGYDGASAMSGYLHGAQEYIKKTFTWLFMAQCSFTQSCIGKRQLIALNKKLVLRFKELYPAINFALEKLESSINKETAQKSCQLLSTIKDAKFVIPLIIIENIFSYTLTLCKQLQTINADLVEACNHVDNVLLILDEMRENCNKHFSGMFSVVAIMLNKNKEEIDFPRIAKRQTHRNNVSANTSEEYYKLNIFLPFIDHIRIQLSDRFQKHKSLISSLQQIIPSKCIYSTSEEINDCVQFYSQILIEPSVFKAEFSIWKSKWLKEESRPNTAISGLDNSTPERTFSSLKRLKTYLRNSTGETRLDGLALMSIHREINVDPEEVLNRFAKQSRKMMLL
ncbi:52 kDa repressor of the inhibitor of the protein kinase-like [Acyrthosiphon pisum]|uniref:DUF4371 domain-containing protein n=1 Tax=Acyrthosiphon pisum TaxID=7029 RepID=A0A8R2JMV8_ACYPI|nr:52 kDa repressor of the inhibitor of the protein kinase-like [Acyrthosiphon pisum]